MDIDEDMIEGEVKSVKKALLMEANENFVNLVVLIALIVGVLCGRMGKVEHGWSGP